MKTNFKVRLRVTIKFTVASKLSIFNFIWAIKII